MKKLISKVLLSVFVLQLNTLSVQARDGNNGGNGGHPYAAEFRGMIDQIVKEMDECQTWELEGIKEKIFTYKFKTEVKTTYVEIKKRGELIDKRGFSVSALNFPEDKQIKVLATDWELIKNDHDGKRNLVLHEYLGIHNAEVDNYRLSQKMLEEINICMTDPIRLKKIENEIQSKNQARITKYLAMPVWEIIFEARSGIGACIYSTFSGA